MDVVEANQVNILSFPVLRNLEKIQNAQKTRRLGQRGSDIRETDRLYRIDFNLPLIVHSVAAPHFDVGTQPDPNTAGNFSTAHTLA